MTEQRKSFKLRAYQNCTSESLIGNKDYNSQNSEIHKPREGTRLNDRYPIFEQVSTKIKGTEFSVRSFVKWKSTLNNSWSTC